MTKRTTSVAGALADIESRHRVKLSPLEEAWAEQLRRAERRLDGIEEQLDRDGLVVAGSRGQLRSHPLVKNERELLREIRLSLRQLERAVAQRAQLERVRAARSRA